MVSIPEFDDQQLKLDVMTSGWSLEMARGDQIVFWSIDDGAKPPDVLEELILRYRKAPTHDLQQ